MNVLIIPEDFEKDQYVLKPIVAALMRKLEKPRADVRVCHDPRLRGITEALDWRTLQEIIIRYQPTVNLFLLCVDRDGEPTRRAKLDHIETQVAAIMRAGRGFLGENAWQEIEVWVLAGHRLPRKWRWKEIRHDPHPKERYFDPFAVQMGVREERDGGRKLLAEEAARSYDRIRQLCPEDVVALETRIQRWMEANG